MTSIDDRGADDVIEARIVLFRPGIAAFEEWRSFAMDLNYEKAKESPPQQATSNEARIPPLLAVGLSMRSYRPIKLPARLEIACQLLFGQNRANHLDRDAVLFQNRVVKCAIGHLARIHQLFV